MSIFAGTSPILYQLLSKTAACLLFGERLRLRVRLVETVKEDPVTDLSHFCIAKFKILCKFLLIRHFETLIFLIKLS